MAAVDAAPGRNRPAAETASEAAAETLAEATEATDEARQVLEEIRGRLRAAQNRCGRTPMYKLSIRSAREQDPLERRYRRG